MDNTETNLKQSSEEKELNENLEEVILLLGLNSSRDIDKVKEFLITYKNNLLKTIRAFLSSSKHTSNLENSNFPTATHQEERKETLQEKLKLEYQPPNIIPYTNEFPNIHIFFKVKTPSNFASTIEESKENLMNRTIQFSKEYVEKVRESFAKLEKPSEENNKTIKNQKTSKLEKRATDIRRNMNRKKNNSNNNFNNSNNTNNQKYGNNNKNIDKYYDNNYHGESNNYNNNNQGYNKKNSNYNKNKPYSNNGKSNNFFNGYGNDFSNAYNYENMNNVNKNGGFQKKNGQYGKNKQYN